MKVSRIFHILIAVLLQYYWLILPMIVYSLIYEWIIQHGTGNLIYIDYLSHIKLVVVLADLIFFLEKKVGEN